MLGDVEAIWAAGSAGLAVWYWICVLRYFRCQAARRVGEAAEHSTSNRLDLVRDLLAQGSSLRTRQADPALESLRHRALLSLAAFLLFGFFGFPLCANVASGISPWLPHVSLPQFGSANGGSANTVFAVVAVAYIIFMAWQIALAFRGGPDWVTGRPGDPIRF